MSKSLHHCGHCGSLFESEPGCDDERVCGVCLQKPGTGLWPSNGGKGGDPRQDLAAVFSRKGETIKNGGEDPAGKRPHKGITLGIVAVWAVLIGLGVWRFNHDSNPDKDRRNPMPHDADMAEGTLADERVALLNGALPECHQALVGFLSAGSPEERNQFVADPVAMAGRMAVFYTLNPFPRVDVEKLRRIGQDTMRIGGEWMIGTRWQEGEDGAIYDAVFRMESGVWMLDWKQFSRYCDYPWALFLAGGGPGQGEFRLLARKASGLDESGAVLRFALLSPVMGKPLSTGVSSSVFEVPRGSDTGLVLQAAFDAKDDGKHHFGSGMEAMEPEGMVRVTVTVKRTDSGGNRSFEVGKVIASHWIDSDDPGFDLEKLKDDFSGGL